MKITSIYASTPVDRTAAMVTSQKGCANTSNLSPEQLRENLVVREKKLKYTLMCLPKGSIERKQVAKEFHATCTKINAIRPKKRCPGIESFFVGEARKYLTKYQFDTIMNRAGNEYEKKREKDMDGITYE